MATLPNIPFESAAITDFCERWKIAELALFGSALREDFGPESDVDFLVTLAAQRALSFQGELTEEEFAEDLKSQS